VAVRTPETSVYSNKTTEDSKLRSRTHTHTRRRENLKSHIVMALVTSPVMDTAVKQWVQLWDQLLYEYEFNCHTRTVWLPRLPNLTLHAPILTGTSLVSTSEVCMSAILERF
jgi:hypothetical protein